MRTVNQIVKEAGGAAALANKLCVPSVHTITAWMSRGSIPATKWKALSDHGFATLEELAELAASRPSPQQSEAA